MCLVALGIAGLAHLGKKKLRLVAWKAPRDWLGLTNRIAVAWLKLNARGGRSILAWLGPSHGSVVVTSRWMEREDA